MTKNNKKALDAMASTFNAFEMVGAVKPLQADLIEMARIYKEEFNQPTNIWCTSCVIEMIRVLNNLRKGITQTNNK